MKITTSITFISNFYKRIRLLISEIFQDKFVLCRWQIHSRAPSFFFYKKIRFTMPNSGTNMPWTTKRGEREEMLEAHRNMQRVKREIPRIKVEIV